MTRDDIIRMAREAGADCAFAVHIPAWDMSTWEFMERFATLVAAAEREACAKVCESIEQDPYEDRLYRSDFADAIRARGEKK